MAIHVKSGSGVVEYTNKAWVAGDRMVPAIADATTDSLTGRKWVWECTTAGTSTATPVWPAAVTQDVTTVTQGGVIWTARKPGYSSGSIGNWSFATPMLHYATLARGPGETVDVSHLHNELVSTNTGNGVGTINDPCIVRCVNEGAIPATTLATTAVVGTLGNGAISYNTGYMYFYGITFNVGSGLNTGVINILNNTGSTGSGNYFFENCNLNITTTGVSSTIQLGNASGFQHLITFVNTSIRGNVSGQALNIAAKLVWDGGAVTCAAASPTAPLLRISGRGELIATGVDFSSLPASLGLMRFSANGQGKATFRAPLLPSGWSGEVADTAVVAGSAVAELHAGGHTGGEVVLRYRNVGGTVRDESVIVRSGGQVRKGAGYSFKAVTDANASYPVVPLVTPEIPAVWNTAVGTLVTVEVEFVHDNLTPLTNADIWLDLYVLNTLGSHRAAMVSNRKAIMAEPVAHAASASVWTTTGLVEPRKQKLVLQVTPREVGFLQAKVSIAKPGPYTVYVDPKIKVS